MIATEGIIYTMTTKLLVIQLIGAAIKTKYLSLILRNELTFDAYLCFS